METFIILVALTAAAGGSLILLTCLAGKRAQLIKAFNLQQEMEEREAQIEKNKSKLLANESDSAPTPSEAAAE